MVRHAESEFNKYVHIPSAFLEEPLRSNLHHNTKLIDCSLSKEGFLQAQRTILPLSYLQTNRKVDILFVSPLTRALETAELLIKTNRLEVKYVIVLPELTEVLSKICDFSSPIEEKRRRFRTFDFSEMDRFLQEKRGQLRSE
jgi:broad specificity phosphatase PhoE